MICNLDNFVAVLKFDLAGAIGIFFKHLGKNEALFLVCYPNKFFVRPFSLKIGENVAFKFKNLWGPTINPDKNNYTLGDFASVEA